MDKLNEIFYNSKSGYMSKNKFVKIARLQGISKDEANDFFNNQAVNQIYKRQNQKKYYATIESPRFEAGTLQIDLMIMSKFPKKINKGYVYLLNILDVYSRYVKSYPLKKKSDVEIFPHIKSYLAEFRKLYPNNKITITMDAGSEFKGKVKKYFNENDIKIYIATPGENTKNRTYLVERYHRTFWDKLKKILTKEETLKWVDYYEDMTENYNNTVHSKTEMTPHSIFIDGERRGLETFANYFKSQSSKGKDSFIVGDIVRVLKNKKLFTKKSFTPNWSIKTYAIDSIEGKRYFLKYLNGNEKPGSFLSRELQRVKETEDKTEYQNKVKENEKENKKVRKLKKEKIHDVEDGEYVVNKRLIPSSSKRISKKPKRYS